MSAYPEKLVRAAQLEAQALTLRQQEYERLRRVGAPYSEADEATIQRAWSLENEANELRLGAMEDNLK